MSLWHNIHLEWWQAMAMVFLVGVYPLFKALAVILVARFVKPEIAKLALPLIFHRKSGLSLWGHPTVVGDDRCVSIAGRLPQLDAEARRIEEPANSD
jgi:hypothetical protein